MADGFDDLLQRVAQLAELERYNFMVELGRRYGLPDMSLLESAVPTAEDVAGAPDYRIVFEGGSRGLLGPGWGNYLLSAAGGGPMPLVRLDLGERIAAGEAEYDTLITALQDLLARIGAAGRSAESFSLEILSDSQLMLSQIQGTWNTRDGRLRTRSNVARQLLQRFRAYHLLAAPSGEVARLLGR